MKRFTILLALLCGAIGHVLAQTTISGTITDDTGEALIGASILGQGSTSGAVTDLDGNFTLSIPANVERLIVTYTGFTTQEIPLVAGQTTYTIVLDPAAELLGEVVVTGVGVATDRRRTAISVEAINSDELPAVASGSVDQALIGKVPGAYIQQTSGQPGQQANIILRGINSLQGTTPMILIDGVQVSTDNNFNGSDLNTTSRLADIDFSNVERVEVVQGAAAATIYGAQGANGVIQIFTKKGRVGKPRISLNSTVGVANPLFGDFGYAESHAYQTLPDGRMVSGDGTSALGRNEFGVWNAPLLETEGMVLTDNPYVEETFDLVDQVFKSDVMNYRSSLSISGGSENITYSVTGTYNSQESTIRGENNRYNLGTRLGFQIFDAVDVNLGLRLIRGTNTAGGITGASNVESAIGSVSTTFPFIDFAYRNEAGNLVANPAGDNSVNPLYTEFFRLRETTLSRALPNLNLNWKATDWLTIDYKYGLDYYRDDYNEFTDNQEALLEGSAQAGIPPIQGRIDQRLREGTLQNSILSAYLNFGAEEDILYSTQLVFDWRKDDFDDVRAQGTGLPSWKPVTLGATQQSSIDEIEETFSTYGVLVNQRVEFAGIVGASAGVRADYSSAFGQGSDPFIFPRADVYFRPSELAFWDRAKTSFPEIKVRAAYGQAGVQPGAFDRIRTLNTGQIGNAGFLLPQAELTNPLLEVQVSKEFEIGVDASITPGGRQGGWFPYFRFSATYWDRTSEDVIREIGVAPTTGANTILDNAITLKSNGVQASVQATVLDKPDFKWNFTTNFSRQETVVDDISNGVDIPVGNHFLLQPGEALGTLRGLVALTSVDQRRADGTFYLGDDRSGFEVVPETGYVVNTDGQVQFTNDVQRIGSGLPDFNISFIQDFTIAQAFKVGFQLDWVQGFDVYNQTRQWGYRDNVHTDVDEPVTIGGQRGAFFEYYRTLYNTNNPNSAFLEDGSFLRLRNAFASVDLTEFITVPGVERLELELSGFNLFTITEYTGFDPEAASNLNDPTRIGLDQYAFPNSRVYQIGLNVGF